MILNMRLIVPLDGLEGDRGSGVEALSQHSAKQLHENSANLIILVVTSDFIRDAVIYVLAEFVR